MKDRESISLNGKPAFYASIYEDLRKAALDCGWALGLHGSLASDIDIMAMPWTDNAKGAEEMVEALCNCFSHPPTYVISRDKPNNRIVYTISIWSDFYMDINIIE